MIFNGYTLEPVYNDNKELCYYQYSMSFKEEEE